MRAILFFAVLSMSIYACTSEGTASKSDSGDKATTETTTNSSKIKLSPFSQSPAYADAKIESMTFKNGKFDFGVADGNYKLGVQTPDAPKKMCANSAKGQHIHLIVDNKPYAAKYDASFDYEIEDGEHHLLAFLSRSYHESIKSPGAAKIQKISVKNNSITSAKDIKEPMLFYSRPKGTYVGKANTDKVMLDFYVANATLGNEYSVKAEINGETHVLASWQPYFVEGLPMGENTITLTLIGKDGKPVDTPLNPVTRKFTLKADPTEG